MLTSGLRPPVFSGKVKGGGDGLQSISVEIHIFFMRPSMYSESSYSEGDPIFTLGTFFVITIEACRIPKVFIGSLS